MQALASWCMLCISYDPTSPERFQKLKQSPEVSKRVGNSYSNAIFVATWVFTWVLPSKWLGWLEPTLIFVHFWEGVATKSLPAWVITKAPKQLCLWLTSPLSFQEGCYATSESTKNNDVLAWLPLTRGNVSSSTPSQAKTRGPLRVTNRLLARLYNLLCTFVVINCLTHPFLIDFVFIATLIFVRFWEEPLPPFKLTVYVPNH